MRISILAVSVLVLAACFILIWQSSFHPQLPRLSRVPNSESRASRLVSTDDVLPESSASVDVQQAHVPEWETRFWDIANEPVWMQSQEELEELAGTLNDDQIRDALDKLADERSDAGIILGKFLVMRWAQKAPSEAAQWVANLPDNDFGHGAFKVIVIPWARKDLNSAVGWVQKLPESGNKAAAELSLADEAASQRNAVTAISLVANLPPSSERDGVLNYSVRQWATVDPDNAISWINQIQAPFLREQMLDNVAVDMGVQDPFKAASFAATSLPSGQGQNNAIVDIIRFWAASEPEQAAAWVAQFPSGELRIAAVQNLVDVWSKDDPAAANAWATTVPQ